MSSTTTTNRPILLVQLLYLSLLFLGILHPKTAAMEQNSIESTNHIDKTHNLTSSLSSSAAAATTVSSKQPTLKHFFIYGDKFSGVNYATHLLNNISPKAPLTECQIKTTIPVSNDNTPTDTKNNLSWRHGFFQLESDLIRRLDCHPDQTLFILIVKDPYAWLTSVAERKFQTPSMDLHQIHLNSLILHEWEDTLFLNGDGSDDGISKQRQWRITKTRYKNLMDQRTQKIKAHRRILSKMKHSAIVRYEDLLTNKSVTIKNILRGRGMTIGDIRIPDISKNTATNQLFTAEKQQFIAQKKYLSLFDARSVKKTEKNLDKNIESVIGYHVPPNGPWIIEEQSRQKRIRGGFFTRVWNLAMNVLWWIVVPTIILLLVLTLVVLWQQLSTSKYSFRSQEGMTNSSGRRNTSQWIEAFDRSTGRTYYYNSITRETRWNRPLSSSLVDTSYSGGLRVSDNRSVLRKRRVPYN